MTSLSKHIGIGLRTPHVQQLLESKPEVGWLEIHSENWFAQGGQIAATKRELAACYPISLHGVGLSLGSVEPLDRRHLRQLKCLIDEIDPIFVSEHLSWSKTELYHSNDLLPLPYHMDSIKLLTQRISEVQQYLGRQILVENLSSYALFEQSNLSEWEFIRHVIDQSGCGLLLDINNVYVNSVNHQFSTDLYFDHVPWQAVQEIHLAGHDQDGDILIDTHGQAVQPAVWQLYDQIQPYLNANTRTLIEWDTDLPSLNCLLEEAQKAQIIFEKHHHA